MTMQARRVVTGHDENGDAVVVSDERLTAVSRGLGAGISGCEMWSTNRMPIDNSAAADAAQRAGFVSHYIHANNIGTGAGAQRSGLLNLRPATRDSHTVPRLRTTWLSCRARLTWNLKTTKSYT